LHNDEYKWAIDPYNKTEEYIMSVSILAVGPNGGTARYGSLRKASRVLSGNGSDSVRSTITRRVDQGGGFIGDVWVQLSDIPSIRRPR
jgi:hypothetical protein